VSPERGASNAPTLVRVPASARANALRVESVPYLKYTTALGFPPRSSSAPFRVAPEPTRFVAGMVVTLRSIVGQGSWNITKDNVAPQTSPTVVAAQAW